MSCYVPLAIRGLPWGRVLASMLDHAQELGPNQQPLYWLMGKRLRDLWGQVFLEGTRHSMG